MKKPSIALALCGLFLSATAAQELPPGTDPLSPITAKSACGGTLLVGTAAGSVFERDSDGESYRCLLALARGPVTSLSMTADGNLMAIVADRRLYLWSRSSPSSVQRISVAENPSEVVGRVALSPDGKRAIVVKMAAPEVDDSWYRDIFIDTSTWTSPFRIPSGTTFTDDGKALESRDFDYEGPRDEREIPTRDIVTTTDFSGKLLSSESVERRDADGEGKERESGRLFEPRLSWTAFGLMADSPDDNVPPSFLIGGTEPLGDYPFLGEGEPDGLTVTRSNSAGNDIFQLSRAADGGQAGGWVGPKVLGDIGFRALSARRNILAVEVKKYGKELSLRLYDWGTGALTKSIPLPPIDDSFQAYSYGDSEDRYRRWPRFSSDGRYLVFTESRVTLDMDSLFLRPFDGCSIFGLDGKVVSVAEPELFGCFSISGQAFPAAAGQVGGAVSLAINPQRSVIAYLDEAGTVFFREIATGKVIAQGTLRETKPAKGEGGRFSLDGAASASRALRAPAYSAAAVPKGLAKPRPSDIVVKIPWNEDK